METYPEGVAQFRQWFVDAAASNTVLELYVAVDQGATNARVAIGMPTGDFAQLCKFQAASTAQLVERLGEVAAWLAAEEPSFRAETVKGACMAAAGRVLEGGARVEITNYAGGAAEQMLSIEELPPALFPPHNMRFLNDLESACYGITALGNAGKLPEYFATLLPYNGPITPVVLRPSQHLVLAVGTGLGVGLLTHPYSGSDFQVLPLEGGHVLLNPVGVEHSFFADEQDLLQFAGHKLYGGKFSVEYEDFVSGRGVLLLYEWISKCHSDAPVLTEPSQVANNACNDPPCPYATKALRLHYEYLMRCAQNLSIGLNAKGIFLAGDNQVSNREFVFNYKETLRQVFLDHPKSAWIDSIPVYSQIKSYPVNIAGALHIAQRCSRI